MPEGVTFGETSAVEGFVGRAHLAVPSGAVFEDGLGGRGVPSVRHQGRAYGVVVFTLEVADIVTLMDGTHLLGEGGKGLYLSIVLGQGQAYLSHRVVGLEAREDEGITFEGITDDLGGRVAEVTEGRAQTFVGLTDGSHYGGIAQHLAVKVSLLIDVSSSSHKDLGAVGRLLLVQALCQLAGGTSTAI